MNYYDLSSRYANILVSISSCFAALAGVITPIVAGEFLSPNVSQRFLLLYLNTIGITLSLSHESMIIDYRNTTRNFFLVLISNSPILVFQNIMGWNGTFYITSAIVLFSALVFIFFGSGNVFSQTLQDIFVFFS